MKNKKSFYLVLILLNLFAFSGCSTLENVEFEKPVDTTTKQIQYQKKQTYHLKEVNVFVSNEFDGARLNDFKMLNDSTALVVVNPENVPINNSAYYSFKTWASNPKPFYFRFQYPKGYKHRYIPKLKVNDQWHKIDSTLVFKTDNIVTIKLNLSETPVIVSAQEIQSTTDVKQWYTNLVKNKEDYVRLQSIGESRLGRNLPVLDIYKGDKKGKPIIVLLTRQHPPEVTGFFAFKAFIEAIVDGKFHLSETFLNKYRVLAFPILNPDGVDLGHWRHNAGGVDLNRDWSMYNQPEIKQVVTYITKAIKKDKAKVILGLDFHSTYEDVFYTNKTRKETTLPNFIEEWFAALETNIPNYKVNEKSENSTKPVSKGWFLYKQNVPGITYEIGDKTPRERIKLVGRVTAEQMMTIVLKTKTNY
ncbi:MAG: M14 family metallopeptidase [Cellulophaga sp.]